MTVPLSRMRTTLLWASCLQKQNATISYVRETGNRVKEAKKYEHGVGVVGEVSPMISLTIRTDRTSG